MNLNQCLFAGRFTRDHELKYTPKGTAVLNTSIAVNRRVKKGDDWEDEVTFVELKAWGQTAEAIVNYTIKGSPVFVQTHLEMESWEDKQSGQRRSKAVFVVDQCQFLERADAQNRRAEQRPQQGQQGGGYSQPRQSQGGNAGGSHGGAGAGYGGDYHDEEDDIPF